jgi:hypothetical protein
MSFEELPLHVVLGIVYVIVTVPETAAGLKVFPVTPFPDQLPPVCPVMKSFKFTVEVVLQKTPGLVQLASGPSFTVIVCVLGKKQPFNDAV